MAIEDVEVVDCHDGRVADGGNGQQASKGGVGGRLSWCDGVDDVCRLALGSGDVTDCYFVFVFGSIRTKYRQSVLHPTFNGWPPTTNRLRPKSLGPSPSRRLPPASQRRVLFSRGGPSPSIPVPRLICARAKPRLRLQPLDGVCCAPNPPLARRDTRRDTRRRLQSTQRPNTRANPSIAALSPLGLARHSLPNMASPADETPETPSVASGQPSPQVTVDCLNEIKTTVLPVAPSAAGA